MSPFGIALLLLVFGSLVWCGWELRRALRTGVVTVYFLVQPVRRDRRDRPWEFWFAIGWYIVSSAGLSLFVLTWLLGLVPLGF